MNGGVVLICNVIVIFSYPLIIASKVIWDSVYYNDVYLNIKQQPPVHDLLCGSMSKVFGVTGLRIGWIASTDNVLFEACVQENIHETCTISRPAQDIALSILEDVDYNYFALEAREAINCNRDELQKISYLISNTDVPVNGMFYNGIADTKAIKLIKDAGVQFIILKEEKNYSNIRFNLAQDNTITQDAVKSILKSDKKS